jgi:membrane protein YdbS with pleckstrin-like domain
MYTPAKSFVLRLFKAPAEPPEPPRGSHGHARVLRASPKYLTYHLLGLGFVAAIVYGLLAVATVAIALSDKPWAALVPLGIGAIAAVPLLIAYFCIRVDYELRYYVLTDKSVRVREGAWVVEEKTITYANVQNVRVAQGPLQRLFGISDVKVDTAGGGASMEAQKHGQTGHGVALAGIENPAEIRDEILAFLRHHGAGAGLGDPDDERRAARSFGAPALAALREMAVEARALRAAAERVV